MFSTLPKPLTKLAHTKQTFAPASATKRFSSPSRHQLRLPAILLALGLPLFNASAATLDWSTGSWNNGSGFNPGYDTGATSGSTISNGITVAATYSAFNLVPEPTNLTVTNTVNGSGAGGDDPVMRLDVEQDNNTGAILTDFTRFSFSFSQAVTLSNVLTIFDVDTSNPTVGFNDYIVVRARIGGPTGTTVGITYTPNGTNHIAANDYGLAGMRANAGSVAQNSDSGNVLVNATGAFDYLEIIFAQAQGNTTGARHLIGISDITFAAAAVPEPGTYILLLLGAGFLLLQNGRSKEAACG